MDKGKTRERVLDRDNGEEKNRREKSRERERHKSTLSFSLCAHRGCSVPVGTSGISGADRRREPRRTHVSPHRGAHRRSSPLHAPRNQRRQQTSAHARQGACALLGLGQVIPGSTWVLQWALPRTKTMYGRQMLRS